MKHTPMGLTEKDVEFHEEKSKIQPKLRILLHAITFLLLFVPSISIRRWFTAPYWLPKFSLLSNYQFTFLKPPPFSPPSEWSGSSISTSVATWVCVGLL